MVKPLFFLFLFLFSVTLAVSVDSKREPRDPEQKLQECRQQCQYQYGRRHEEERRVCERDCKERYEREEEEQGGGNKQDPEKRLEEECRRQCRQEKGKERKSCQQSCEDYHRREQGNDGSKQSEGQGRRLGRNNPYYFSDEHFTARVRSEGGKIRVLDRFSSRSNLLRGIDNYRLAVMDANPNTFIIPHHWDADALLVAFSGKGTIHLMWNKNKESHNIKSGDVLRIPAGTTVFVVNSDNKETLSIARLMLTISTPGRYQAFFPFGGEDPESFYESFDNSVLEAAFNTPRDKLRKLFGQLRKGAIVRASEEKIREIARRTSSSEGGSWPFGRESNRPVNLFNKQAHKNKHGQLYQVNSRDQEQLRDLNVGVSLANIRSGSMMAPFLNSKATVVALVVDGKGYYEAACPFVSNRESKDEDGDREEERSREREPEQQEGISYSQVGGELSPSRVFAVPAGHPCVIVSNQGQDLSVLFFEINAQDNERVFLAGRNMVYQQMDKEEKELTFNMEEREVDEFFKAQRESYFLPGPEQGHSDA